MSRRASPSSSPPAIARRPPVALVAALLVYAGMAFWQSRTFMVWSEEIVVHVMPAARVLAPQLDAAGRPRFEPSCLGPDAPAVLHSASRPTLSVCAGGRAWPVLVAPYFAGYPYWPFALLRPLHHDDAFALRGIALPLGALSIVLTYLVVARLAGRRAAALGALATACMPCFLLVHATLVSFETLPWVFLMGAALVLIGVRGLEPGADGAPLPRGRLVAAALLLGLTLATNLKSIVIVVPLVALAMRLRVPFGRIEKRTWPMLGAAALAPLTPSLALLFAPDVGYTDKSSGWLWTFLAHLVDPRRLAGSVRELVLLWSNVGWYFGRVADPPPFDVPSALVASCVLAFVLFDTGRTIARRRGCPVTAACGVILVSFTLMVGLLYDHFPSNFTPLHSVYAVSVGVVVSRVAAEAARRVGKAWPGALLSAAAIAPFAFDSVGTIRSMADVHLHTNADAERALVAYVAPKETAPVLTADVMLAGVLESLSRGGITTVRAHNYFSACDPLVRNAAAPACLVNRWRRLLPVVVTRPTRLVLPTDWSSWGSNHLDYAPSLREAAGELGYRVTLERTFETRRGAPALSLYLVDPP